MVNSNKKFENVDNGYIPFDIRSNNKENILDSVLLLDNGNFFLGRSFGAKKKIFWGNLF